MTEERTAEPRGVLAVAEDAAWLYLERILLGPSDDEAEAA